MSTTRYDAVAVRKWMDRDGNEQSGFTNIGVAWSMKDRDGYSLKLHCLPAPADGEYTILLFPPKPRDDEAPQRSTGKHRATTAPAFDGGADSDDIPF